MFKKAERRQVKLKLAISAPSGGGKTLSALLIAKGIGGKIAVVDTENQSASLYAGQDGVPDFDTLEIEPPYTTEKYMQAINAAVQAKYDVLIIDSLSHQWAGEGGILSRKEQMDRRGGNSFANWATLTPEHEKLKAALLHADIHLIATLRSKQEYALVGDDKGKNKVQRMGLAPVQREGMEYEFTTWLDMDMSHQASASKDRTGLFDGKLFVPTAETGKALLQWLNRGKVAEPKAPINPVASLPTALPGDGYRIPFGNKFKGMLIDEIAPEELESYCRYIQSSAEKEGKEITGQVKEFMDRAYSVLYGPDAIKDVV